MYPTFLLASGYPEILHKTFHNDHILTKIQDGLQDTFIWTTPLQPIEFVSGRTQVELRKTAHKARHLVHHAHAQGMMGVKPELVLLPTAIPPLLDQLDQQTIYYPIDSSEAYGKKPRCCWSLSVAGNLQASTCYIVVQSSNFFYTLFKFVSFEFLCELSTFFLKSKNHSSIPVTLTPTHIVIISLYHSFLIRSFSLSTSFCSSTALFITSWRLFLHSSNSFLFCCSKHSFWRCSSSKFLISLRKTKHKSYNYQVQNTQYLSCKGHCYNNLSRMHCKQKIAGPYLCISGQGYKKWAKS